MKLEITMIVQILELKKNFFQNLHFMCSIFLVDKFIKSIIAIIFISVGLHFIDLLITAK